MVLFLIQRNGTSKIGYAFSPIMLAFLLFNGGVGAYNIAKHGASVFKVNLNSISLSGPAVITHCQQTAGAGWCAALDALLMHPLSSSAGSG